MARLQELPLPRSNRGLLILAIVAGVIAAALVFVAISGSSEDSRGGSIAPEARTVKAVVAARSIPAGTEVTEDMLKVVDVPADLAVVGAFSSAVPLVGEVTNVAIAQGEQITRAKVGPIVEGEGLSFVVPKGHRALALQVTEVTAVGGHLLPGDRVDVIAAFESPSQDGVTRVVRVLQDIEVLAVAQESQKPVAGLQEGGEPATATGERLTSGHVPADVEKEPNARTITLSVTPQEALLLAYVQQEAATVTTALRPTGERVAPEERATDFAALQEMVRQLKAEE
jgi:pilus assembly protein CpaB